MSNTELEMKEELVEITPPILLCCRCIAVAKNLRISDVINSILEREFTPLLSIIESF